MYHNYEIMAFLDKFEDEDSVSEMQNFVISKAAQPFKSFISASDRELLEITDRTNPRCPFYSRVGQERVIEQLLAILTERMRNEHHAGKSSMALMFTGPASTGKTDFSKILAGEKGLNLPFIQTDGKKVDSSDSIFELMFHAAEESGVPFISLGVDGGRDKYICPPMVMLIDELHSLRTAAMESLLKALESNDCLLITNKAIVDCSHVLWIGATTQRGDIVRRNQPFDSRFEKIEFRSYTRDEVSRIIQLRFGWDMPVCEALAVRSGGIVREAIAIGNKVNRQLNLMQLRDKNATLMDAIASVGEQLGIDAEGMSDKQIAILMALVRRYPKGMTYPQLARTVNRTVQELQEVILPGLMLETIDHSPRVVWSGLTRITREGANELIKRGLIKEFQAE